MKNKKGISTAMIIVLILAALFAYSTNLLGIKTTVDNLFGGGPSEEPIVTAKCPSSGLTEVTINTQKALATTSTNVITDYFVYDGDTIITSGNSGSDGQSVFDVACGSGKTYKVMVANETVSTGYYGQMDTIDASTATDTINLKMYNYGDADISGLANGVQNVGDTVSNWISGGAGKICDWKIVFTVNESASAFNKPLIICQANTTIITDMTLSGVTKQNAKMPSRLSPDAGCASYVWEYDKLLTSEDSMVTLGGKIQFASGATIATPVSDKTVYCKLIDQAYYKKADYQSMTLADGWAISAQNDESVANVGAPDSAIDYLYISDNNSYYC